MNASRYLNQPLYIFVVFAILLNLSSSFLPSYASAATTVSSPKKETTGNAPANPSITSVAASEQPQASSLLEAQQQAQQALNSKSFRFEPNLGQLDARAKFFMRGSGYNLFLTANQAVIDLKKPSKTVSPRDKLQKQGKSEPREGAVVQMTLAGANLNAVVEGEQPLAGKLNYFLSDPQKSRTDVTTFAQVRYKNVYPGIDLLYYSRDGQLEYDFLVNPGSDTSLITWSFEGAERTEIAANGDLVVSVGSLEMRHKMPILLQEFNGTKKTFKGGYIKKGENKYGFEAAGHDKTKLLTIDPVILYSSYFGGNGEDTIRDVALDRQDRIYLAGDTTSSNFPATLGAYTGSGTAAFVARLGNNGTRLDYFTYLDGEGTDRAWAIAVDGTGNAYITGESSSTTGFFDGCVNEPDPLPKEDAFVIKINAFGNSVLYRYCLRGNGGDIGFDIAVDSSGSAYIAGSTGSNNLYTITGVSAGLPIQDGQNEASGQQGFVLKLNPLGSTPTNFTYLGGNEPDAINALALDAARTVYVTGSTESPNFPVKNAAQASLRGSEDSFVARLLMPGNSTVMAYSTFLGGTQKDYSLGIAVDSAGNAYTTGLTYSTDFVTTAGAVQTTLAGGSGDADAFAVKLDRVGNQILYSTYLGSTLPDEASDIAVDTNGIIYLTGITLGGFPATANSSCLSLPPVVTGVFNLFFSKINPALANSQGLIYSISLGSVGNDLAIGLTLDQNNNAYVVGRVQDDFPVLAGGYDTTYNGGPNDGIVIKFTSNTGAPDVPNFDSELDDLYSVAQAVRKTNNPPLTLEVDLPIRRYYGLVNSASNRLIEYDPPAGTTPETIQRNQNLHDPNAILTLWLKPGNTVNTPQQLTVEISGPNNQSSSFQVNVPAIAAVSQPILIFIPTSKLFFPNICQGRTTPNCLRDPGKKNYPDVSDTTTEGASSFQSLMPVVNKIKITGWTSTNTLERVACNPSIFVNGVRPVLFASGFSSDNKVKDNTGDWGGTKPSSEQLIIAPGTSYTNDNWIKWLGDKGIPSWNPPSNGNQSIANQQQYLIEGASLLNRVYGIKRLNLVNLSFGGLTARLFAYNFNVLKTNALFSVDKLLTFGSPHTGVALALTPVKEFIGPAAVDGGSEQMQKFNQKYLGLKDSWRGDDPKNHLFFAATHGKEKKCTFLVVLNCQEVYVLSDNVIESKSALGTSYPVSLPNIVATTLPGLYSTNIPSNLLNICDYVFPNPTPLADKCHTWLPHSVQIANWITTTSGIMGYLNNQVLFPKATFTSTVAKQSLNSSGQGGQDESKTENSNNISFASQYSDISNRSILYNRGVFEPYQSISMVQHSKYNNVLASRISKSHTVSNGFDMLFPNLQAAWSNRNVVLRCSRFYNNSDVVDRFLLSNSTTVNLLTLGRSVFNSRLSSLASCEGVSLEDTTPLDTAKFDTEQIGRSNYNAANFTRSAFVATNDITQTLLYANGGLPPNSTLTIPVKIDNISDVNIRIGATNEASFQARFETSTGTVLISNQTGPVTFSFPGNALTSGTYNLILTTGALSTSAEYIVLAEARSDLIVVPSLAPTTVGSATPGKLSARLVISSTAQAVTGATVTATLVAAPSTGTGTPVTTTLTLLDNGTGGDQTASDGIYTVLLPAGLTSEVLQAEVFASGTYGGNAFTRYEVRLDQARSGELTFAGPYSWQTASGSTLGASTDIDTLSFNAGVNVQQAGTYRVEATLVGADGTSVSNASATVALGTGPNTVKLDFNGLQVWEQQVSGPYRISYLNVFKEAETASDSSYPTDLIADTSTLPVLNITRSQLHRPSFLLSGAVAETSLLPDSSGKPGVLRVNIPLDVAFAKTYSYSAILRTQNGSLVTWTQGKAALGAGVNNTLTLNFKGNEIFAAGLNGPYTVETLIIKDASTSEVLFYLPKVKETVSYQANSFSPCGLFNVTSELDGAVSGSCQLTLRQAIVNANELGDRLITFTLRPNAQITLNSPLVLSVGLALEADCANRVVMLVASFADMVQLDGTNQLKGLLIRSSIGPILKLNGTGNTIECTSVRVGTGP